MPSILKEAERCLKCKVPMCQKGCPISTDIPTVTSLVQEGKIDEAAELLFSNNPLSMICSLVCNHEKQCEGNCVLSRKGNGIKFSTIENYVSDSYFERLDINREENNRKRVAVISSGPAGITVSFVLAKLGYQVTIYEAKEKIGGMLRYGIPEFRLSRTIMDRYHKKLSEYGVQIRPNIIMGETLTIDDLFKDGYVSVFAGTGVLKPNKLGIPGESYGHVHYAIDYLANPEVFELGENVAVIGVGNAAMDVARTALRRGSKNVTLYARRDVSTANSDEIMYTKLDGAKFSFLKKPIRVLEKSLAIGDVELDENGRPGEPINEYEVPADSVVIAISQGPRSRLVSTTEGLESNDWGLLKVDENGVTSHPGVFAAGDVVLGAKTVVAAVNQAKQVAMTMHEYMQNLSDDV